MTKEEMAIVCNSFCCELGIPHKSEICLHDDYSSEDDNSSEMRRIVVSVPTLNSLPSHPQLQSPTLSHHNVYLAR